MFPVSTCLRPSLLHYINFENSSRPRKEIHMLQRRTSACTRLPWTRCISVMQGPNDQELRPAQVKSTSCHHASASRENHLYSRTLMGHNHHGNHHPRDAPCFSSLQSTFKYLYYSARPLYSPTPDVTFSRTTPKDSRSYPIPYVLRGTLSSYSPIHGCDR
jgi:hypothetical protein